MKRPIALLSLLLVVQVGLALALHLADRRGEAADASRKLLEFTTDQVDTVELSGSDSSRVTLKKTPQGWVVSERFNVAADQGKVEELLSVLTRIERPWPVAETAEAHKRFKVDDAGFERRLVFRSRDKALATLLLGSSPGFRKVHARLAGEKAVYDIPFSTYQASCKPQDWIDHGLLVLPAEDVTGVTLPDCRLVQQEGKWRLEGDDSGAALDAGQVRKLLERISGLRIRDISGRADQPLSQPVELRIGLTLKDGTTRTYLFAKEDKAGYDRLQVSGFADLFQVSGGLVEELRGFDRAHLTRTGAAASPTSGTGKPAPAEAPAR
jgi:hypothetical protein